MTVDFDALDQRVEIRIARRGNSVRDKGMVEERRIKLDHPGTFGDLLLQKVSSLFLSRIRRSDTVARTGGDEFSVILEEPISHTNAELVAQSLLQLLDEPVQLLEHRFKVGASIGIALYPDDAADMEALCVYADLQMYESKKSSRDRSQTPILATPSPPA